MSKIMSLFASYASQAAEGSGEELNFFQQIIKAVTDFFAQIAVWFENLFAGLKK